MKNLSSKSSIVSRGQDFMGRKTVMMSKIGRTLWTLIFLPAVAVAGIKVGEIPHIFLKVDVDKNEAKALYEALNLTETSQQTKRGLVTTKAIGFGAMPLGKDKRYK